MQAPRQEKTKLDFVVDFNTGPAATRGSGARPVLLRGCSSLGRLMYFRHSKKRRCMFPCKSDRPELHRNLAILFARAFRLILPLRIPRSCRTNPCRVVMSVFVLMFAGFVTSNSVKDYCVTRRLHMLCQSRVQLALQLVAAATCGDVRSSHNMCGGCSRPTMTFAYLGIGRHVSRYSELPKFAV